MSWRFVSDFPSGRNIFFFETIEQMFMEIIRVINIRAKG